ncbi:MAG: HAD-IB family hydrolase [Bacteroidales bacterium]|jgi:HAD superfamily hydrolase (TIGR01490 family)
MAIITSKEDKGFKYIAFFDLDRTITKAISGRAIAIGAFKNGLMKRENIAGALYLGISYRLGLADPARASEKMIGWIKGIPEKVIADLCEEVFRKVMLPSIYREAAAEIKIHKANDARIVILSSSLAPICRAIADYLNFDDIICSRLEVLNGCFTGRPEGYLCYGNEKLARLREYCEKNNSAPESSWYYADAIIDLPALSAVGFPICVNPDNRLKKAALVKGWKIVHWK